MHAPSFQTVRLARGKHRSPNDGVCVMELASMIADEPFTDRPATCDRVIGAVLRAYNDLSPHRRRQDLYRCAADVVGTRGGPELERLRLQHCFDLVGELDARRDRSLRMRVLSPSGDTVQAYIAGPGATGKPLEMFAEGMARMLVADGRRGHARMLALIDELIALRVSAPVRELVLT